MTAEDPVLSIVIAVHNAAELLRRSLASIPERSGFRFELIIQDGMSSDDIVEIVKAFSHLPIAFESVPDSGIYDAWNKALSRVRGQWVIFSGAGDILNWPVLEQCVAAVENLPGSVCFYATPVRLITKTERCIDVFKPSSAFFQQLPQEMPVPHPGLFHRSSLFIAHRFDATCRIAGDYDFLCRTLRADNLAIGSLAFASMLAGGVSGSIETLFASECEMLRFSRRYFPKVVPWKPLLRLLRSGSYLAVRRVFGPQLARYVADFPRIAQGKARLWSLPPQPEGSALPPLPDVPRIDLLIATLGRVDELDRLLTSLEAQTFRNFHVFLADQNAPGHLDAMLARHSSLPITRILLPPRGVSLARNALLPLAQGEIIAFPDDDCWYARDTLSHVIENFRHNAFCGALLGKWKPNEMEARPAGKARAVGRIVLFRHGGTCVQFFRKEVVENIRFDPLLGPGTGMPYGCGEDTDFLLYVYAKTEVRRCHDIRIFHPSPFETQVTVEKVRAYAAGRMFLLRKHNFSFLFRMVNVFYPLCALPLDMLRHGMRGGGYRWLMFRERLRVFVRTEDKK